MLLLLKHKLNKTMQLHKIVAHLHNTNYINKRLLATYPKYSNRQPESFFLEPRFSGPISFLRAPVEQDLTKVDVGLIGVPYDGALTNRPGAKYGPREIRLQSTNLIRAINQFTNISPHTTKYLLRDIGDCPISHPFSIETAHQCIQEFYEKLHSAGILPLTVGGDHSISLPIMRAIAKDRPVGMVHIDAHCDTAGPYGGSKFNHGTPFRVAVEEGLLDPVRTIQIGIRGPINDTSMWAFSYESGMRVMAMEEFYTLIRDRGISSIIDEIYRICGTEFPTYLSFDIDAIDPAYAPGTGTPEIAGILPIEAQIILRKLSDLNLIGADLVEISPPYDQTGGTSLVGANLLFEMACVIIDNLNKRNSK